MSNIKYFIGLSLAFSFALSANAQLGGNYIYQFLQLSPSARVTALGGNLITVRDAEVALAYSNPALLNAKMHHSISFSQDIHPAGISFGNLSYGYHVDKWATTMQGGIQYINYGSFKETTPEGNIIGEFRASEYAINLGAGRNFSEQLSMGVNMKTIFSQLGGYNSIGLAFDAAAMYEDTAKRISLTMVFRNMGVQLSRYHANGARELLPFEIQLGFAHRLKYVPVRFSIIAQQLQRWNIRYDDPALRDANNLFGTTDTTTTNTFANGVDNFFRHFIFNVELLLGKTEALRIRLGYNHLRGAELRVRDLRSLGGFTAGVGIKISRFRLDYGFGSYHFAGSAHHFTLSTNINEWIKAK
jgi:hypothetical protein